MQRLTKTQTLNSTMKKLLTLVLAGGMMAFYACGPSAEEVAKEKQRVDDSIKMADSLANAAAAEKQKAYDDSVANAAAQAAAQHAADSARVADSLAALKGKPKPKTIEQKTKDEAKKATGGRG